MSKGQRKNQNGERNRSNTTMDKPRERDYYREEEEDLNKNRQNRERSQSDFKYPSYGSGRERNEQVADRNWNDYNFSDRSRNQSGERGYEELERGRYRELELEESDYRGRDSDRISTRRRPKSMNFEEYAGQGNRFIKDVAEEMQTDRDTASRVTRSIIHALRDRLPPDDAIQFAQGLPMALKGVFLDQYDISKTPVAIRKADEFLDYIRYKDRFAAVRDFPTLNDVAKGFRAVFYVLEIHMDRGQIEQVKNNLPTSIVRIIDSSW